MTVSVQDPIKKYMGNSSAVSFSFPYRVIDASDLRVYLDGALQTTGYSVIGLNDDTGGTVVFSTAPGSGVLVILQRLVSLDRDVDYQEAAAIPTDTLDRDFDRAWMAIQDGRAASIEIVGGDLLDAKNQRIINLADPVGAKDAVTKTWAETGMSSQLTIATAQAVISTTKAAEAAASAASALADKTIATAQAVISTTKAAEAAVSSAFAAASTADALDYRNTANSHRAAAAASETQATAQAVISTTKAEEALASAASAATSAAASEDLYQDLVDALADGSVASVNGRGGLVVLTKADVSLSNVDNTSDVNKPISALAQAAITAAAPAGCVQYFAGATVPAGWLKANGAAISRTTYGALFAAIGTIYGAGDGTTTFNVPDLRSEFIRGLDDGRGIDVSRAIGSAQASQNIMHAHGHDNAWHTHNISDPGHAHGVYDPGHVHVAWTDGQGEHSHHVNDPGHAHGGSARGGGGVHYASTGPHPSPSYGATDSSGTGIWLNGAGHHGHNVGIGLSGTSIGTYGAGTGISVNWAGTGLTIYGDGGGEARPRNLAMLAIIKF